jgi:hypothetical protein
MFAKGKPTHATLLFDQCKRGPVASAGKIKGLRGAKLGNA